MLGLSLLAALSVLVFALALAASGLVPMARASLVTVGGAMRAMRDPQLDDDDRERLARSGAVALLRAFAGITLRTVAALAASLLPLLLAHAVGLQPLDRSLAFLARWEVIATTVVAGCAIWYAGGRLLPAPVPGYGTVEQLLHRFALHGRRVPGILHEAERSRFLDRAPAARDGAHVFVCGLARAGTTALTRALHRTGAFGSLTYRDMPFVLAPNLFAGMSGRGNVARAERAHGDGLEVDLDSPEALDEVYWRVKDGPGYILPDRLLPHAPAPALLEGYADLVRLVLLKTGRERYLSKNNNNILRLPALVAAFPGAQFLVPIRAPAQHAASLLRQHRRFDAAGGFEKAYVEWLGHHEFGAGHRPFAFAPLAQPTPDAPDYWLALWLAAHRHLSSQNLGPRVIFVPHDRLTGDAAYRRRLQLAVGIDPATAGPDEELREMPARATPAFDPVLLAEAEALYDALEDRALKQV